MNKLQREIVKAVNSKRNNFLSHFELLYLDDSRWESKLSQDLIRNVYYSGALSDWLKGVLFFGFDVEEFVNKYLKKKFDDKFIDNELSLEQAYLIHLYFIDRFVVSLLVEKQPNLDLLKQSKNYYQLYIKKRGFKNEMDMLNDKEMVLSNALFNVVPSGLVRHLLGQDIELLTNKISRDVRTFDMIWSYAWRVLSRLHTGSLDHIDKHWKNLMDGWKKCFIKNEFHAFCPSLIVLLYNSYCEAINQKFKIENLIHEIMN